MSIENNLERIATALEAIAVSMKAADDVLYTKPAEPKSKKAPKAEVPAAPVAPPAAPAAPITLQPGESVAFAGGTLTNPAGAPPAPVPVAPPVPAAPAPAPVVQMTAEQLNAALVAEVGRIGAQEPIAQVIRDLGYNGLREMPQSLYGELLNRVKAL